MNTIQFVLDNKIVEIDFNSIPELKPTTTVLNFLRSYPNHKGVKEGCAEGDCGACTVVLAENINSKLSYKSIDSCLVFLPMLHGKQLITVENLAVKNGYNTDLHPVQKWMVEMYGSQCGYCTPGIIMSLFALYKNHNNPSKEIIEDALTGNLCRCTGYQPIIEAASKACVFNGVDHFTDNEKNIIALLGKINNSESITLKKGNQTYIKPASLRDLLAMRKQFSDAILINGATDIALQQTKKFELLEMIMDISGVFELKDFSEDANSYFFGSGVTMENLKCLTETKIPALYNILKVFASLQIRNIATIGGNIGSASPIGDTLPVLFAHKAKLLLKSTDETREVAIEDFITGYRTTCLKQDEIIAGVIIPKSFTDIQIKSYKVSKRKDLDISTVSATFCLALDASKNVSDIVLAYGGMAAFPKRASLTEKKLLNQKWTRENVENAMEVLYKEFVPLSDARSGAEYRKLVARNLLLKFYSETC